MMAETQSARSESTLPSTKDEHDNLNRLLNIFNGGTGANLGVLIVRVVKAHALYDISTETEAELRHADNIMASLQGWKVRQTPDVILRLEEGKDQRKFIKHGREEVKVAKHGRVQTPPDDVSERRVTINDTRGPPKTVPHLTQRVKTFYMDPWRDPSVSKRDTVIIPNVSSMSARARSMIGGTPITRETAIELRNITLGSTVHSFSTEWRKSSLLFMDISCKYAYGLQTLKCGSRTLVLCMQGYLLKHLLFIREFTSEQGLKNAIQPTDYERRRALCGAICEVLWQAGNQTRCCICLQQEDAFFDTDYRYRVDGITEKLNLYEFKNYQDLEMFVKRHLSHFEHQNSHGCILLLYSIILSRTVPRILEDLDTPPSDKMTLLTENEHCKPVLVNLILTGRAVSNYHNGNIIYDSDGKLLPCPLRGLRERSHVGLLHWNKDEDPDERTEIGSMLKTPKNPIWLTLVNNQYGLLFSMNRDLVSDWRVEHHFTLYYYTGLSQNTVTPLTIETLRVPKTETKEAQMSTYNTRYNRRMRCKTGITRKAEEKRIPPLEQAILSKWYGANIDWNGVFPFV